MTCKTKKKKLADQAAKAEAAVVALNKAATAKAEAAAKPVKTRKLSFKDTQELAGMEAKIHEVEAEIARIEGLFATPDFHRNHAVQSKQLVVDLEKHRENLTQLFARWEELDALKVAVEKV